MNYLLRLASNHDLPNFSLPSSKDYRREPPVCDSLQDILPVRLQVHRDVVTCLGSHSGSGDNS
jgi:hypothetical protein